MKHTLSLAVLALGTAAALVGCPEPVATDDATISPDQAGPGGQLPGGQGPGAGTPPTPGGGSGGGAPAGEVGSGGQLPNGTEVPAAGTFGSMVPDAELDPRYKQEDITDGTVVKGTTACTDCSGSVLIRVLPPPPDQGGSDEEIHLVTVKSYPEAGPFEIKIPAAYEKAVLQVVDDADGNGKPSANERMGLPTGGPVALNGAEVTGIELTVGVFPDQPAVDGAGSPMPSEPTPGSGGAPTATPPTEGGPTPDGAPPTVAPTPGEAGPPPEVATPPAGG